MVRLVKIPQCRTFFFAEPLFHSRVHTSCISLLSSVSPRQLGEGGEELGKEGCIERGPEERRKEDGGGGGGGGGGGAEDQGESGQRRREQSK